VLQPVVQFGTAIHGKSLSGGALNGVQKLLLVQEILSAQRKKACYPVWILANKAATPGVAAVTRA
jgi:hypothetical protein